MRPPTRWHFGALVLAILVAAALGGASATARGMSATSAATAGTMTYTDPAGDTQGGPDVVAVTIVGDPATSMLTFNVTAPGFMPKTPDSFDRNVIFWIDTDRNRATGDPQDGTEYGLALWNDSTGVYWYLERWNGSDWVDAPPSPAASAGHSGDLLRATLSTNDIGGATSFRFYIHACIWDPAAQQHVAVDEAPDNGWWDYSLTGTTPTPTPTPPAATTKVSLLINAPKTAPAQAVAGKRFTVTFPVQFQVKKPVTSVDLATGETKTGTMISWTDVSSGHMVCDPSVAGKVIAHAESFKGSQARLSFVIPKTAKGKLLKVKVKITATEKETGKEVSATKIATFRVH
jgi:hypothetical protein